MRMKIMQKIKAKLFVSTDTDGNQSADVDGTYEEIAEMLANFLMNSKEHAGHMEKAFAVALVAYCSVTGLDPVELTKWAVKNTTDIQIIKNKN